MRAAATTSAPISAPVALPSLGYGRAVFARSAKRILEFFSSWRAGTELVRDPFSAEQTRD